MKRAVTTLWRGLALGAFVIMPAIRAADPPPANAAPVLLPPMLVEESKTSAPWYYANAGGTEFLSRCSEYTTSEFVDAWLNRMQLLRVLIPDPFLARMDVPAVCILYAQNLNQTLSVEIRHELETANGGKVNLAPNMRLADRDMHATIVYLDEALFEGAQLSLAPGHVRYLLQGRVPELPAWLVDGIERLWRSADFRIEPITIGPLVWQSQSESSALADDPTHPHALLPASELFAPEPRRAAENQHPRHRQTRDCQQELFVRWALTTNDATRAALWKFAARAAEGPVTEEMFEACFGFDFSELRDQLSDYLPKAVTGTVRISPYPLPPSPDFKVERATPNQIARVRGEWERLAIWYIQHRLPEAREPYIAQARRTLHRAYDAGDRDPRLLAIMGLCEIDAGNPTSARDYLGPATDSSVVRPSAYYELARIRFTELQRKTPDSQLLTLSDLVPVLRPLQRSLTQAPPMSEIFTLLAEAWARCESAPSAAEFAELETGARLFARRPTVAYPTALVFSRHGKKTEAAALLDACAGYATDDHTLDGIVRLRAELMAAAR